MKLAFRHPRGFESPPSRLQVETGAPCRACLFDLCLVLVILFNLVVCLSFHSSQTVSVFPASRLAVTGSWSVFIVGTLILLCGFLWKLPIFFLLINYLIYYSFWHELCFLNFFVLQNHGIVFCRLGYINEVNLKKICKFVMRWCDGVAQERKAH